MDFIFVTSKEKIPLHKFALTIHEVPGIAPIHRYIKQIQLNIFFCNGTNVPELELQTSHSSRPLQWTLQKQNNVLVLDVKV